MDERMLNELLECSVCLDRMDTSSKVLPCQHTFCRRCLEEIVSTKNELRCPECRSVVEIKVEELPPNILLIRLLEGMKTANNPPPKEPRPMNAYLPNSSISGRLMQQNISQKVAANTQPSAKALFNYDGKEPGDLSFKKGDIILLKKKVDENWFHGELSGQCGFFPISYVQVINKLPSPTPKCKALFDFEIDENEKDCLKFSKDEVLTVIRRVDDNWAEGKHGDRIGIFPIAFVEMNHAAKSLLDSQRGQATSSSANVPKAQKRHSLTSLSPTHNPAIAVQQRHSTELGNCVASQGQSVAGGSTQGPAVPVQTVSRNQSGPSNNSSNRSEISPHQIYMSLYNYRPQKADEVELRKNDFYQVSEKCQDGWFKGTCLRTGKEGVFPGNYVQPARAPVLAGKTSVHGDVRNIRATDTAALDYQITRQMSGQSPPTGGPPRGAATQAMSRSMSSPTPPLQAGASSQSPPGRPSPPIARQQSSSSSRSHSQPRIMTKTSKTNANVAPSSTGNSPRNTPEGQPLSPPNTVTLVPPSRPMSAAGGATGATVLLPLTKQEKKEKKEKEKVSLMKRLTSAGKPKKSKSPPPVMDGPIPGDSPVIGHTRSGSLPLVDLDVSEEGASVTLVPYHQKSGSLDSCTPSAHRPKPKPLVRERYRCIVPYPPNSDVELELKVGDVVYVHKKRDDGWFKGTLSRTGKTGLFPGSFVEAF